MYLAVGDLVFAAGCFAYCRWRFAYLPVGDLDLVFAGG